MGYGILGMLLRGKRPWREIKNYARDRGMTWYNDRVDWLGGFPYEYASLEEIITYLEARGFVCERVKANDGVGCNQYLFLRKREHAE